MIVYTEEHGFTLVFKDVPDLKRVSELLTDGLKGFKTQKTKPPFLISFYTDTGVTPEFMKTHLTELKKRFTNGK